MPAFRSRTNAILADGPGGPGASTPPSEPGRTLVRLGAVLFGVGVIAIVVTVIGFALDDGNRPLWQNMLCLLAPVGFALLIIGLVRSGRASARDAALQLGESLDRVRRPAYAPGRWELAFRLVAMAEGVSWLLLILATVVKYTSGNQIAVHVLGPVHGALFTAYLGLALVVGWRLRWSIVTIVIVLAESLIPGGGLLAGRRADLRSR